MRAGCGPGRPRSASAAEVTLVGDEETGAHRAPRRQAQAPSRGVPGGRLDKGTLGLLYSGQQGWRPRTPESRRGKKSEKQPSRGQPGSQAPSPHPAEKLAPAGPYCVWGCVRARSRVSLTPRSACPQGRPGRSPRGNGEVCRDDPREEPACNGLALIP